jgi:hypothetical protein
VSESTIKIVFDATRKEYPAGWPLVLPWELIMLFVWRGLVNPALWGIDCAWRWLGRGRIEWEHWSPRVGDQVSTCTGGVSTVVAVSLWQDWVITDDGDDQWHRDSLRNCCEPVSREEATDQ